MKIEIIVICIVVTLLAIIVAIKSLGLKKPQDYLYKDSNYKMKEGKKWHIEIGKGRKS